MATKAKAINVDLNSVFEGAASQFRGLNPQRARPMADSSQGAGLGGRGLFMVVLGWFFLLSPAHEELDAEREHASRR